MVYYRSRRPRSRFRRVYARRTRKFRRYRRSRRAGRSRALVSRRRGRVTRPGRAYGSNVPRNVFTANSQKRFLRYENIGVAVTVPPFTVIGRSVWGPTSLHDVDISGIGHQPMGYDNLAAQFTEFQVLWFKAEIVLRSSDTTAPIYVVTRLIRNDNVPANGSLIQVLENGNCVRRYFDPADSTRYPKITITCNPNKFRQSDKNDDDCWTTAGTIATGLAHQPFLQILAAHYDVNLDTPTTLYFDIKFTFLTEWRHQKVIPLN